MMTRRFMVQERTQSGWRTLQEFSDPASSSMVEESLRSQGRDVRSVMILKRDLQGLLRTIGALIMIILMTVLVNTSSSLQEISSEFNGCVAIIMIFAVPALIYELFSREVGR